CFRCLRFALDERRIVFAPAVARAARSVAQSAFAGRFSDRGSLSGRLGGRDRGGVSTGATPLQRRFDGEGSRKHLLARPSRNVLVQAQEGAGDARRRRGRGGTRTRKTQSCPE